jgi:hypothetical protein
VYEPSLAKHYRNTVHSLQPVSIKRETPTKCHKEPNTRKRSRSDAKTDNRSTAMNGIPRGYSWAWLGTLTGKLAQIPGEGGEVGQNLPHAATLTGADCRTASPLRKTAPIVMENCHVEFWGPPGVRNKIFSAIRGNHRVLLNFVFARVRMKYREFSWSFTTANQYDPPTEEKHFPTG